MAKNGQIPKAQLEQVDGWAWLAPGTASAWEAMCAEAVHLWGIRPTITKPDGAYRSLARQVWWWVRRFIFHIVVAQPGRSNHGLGTAIDVYNWARFPRIQFVALANRHGFVFDTPSEKWHMRYTRAPFYHDTATVTLITLEKTMRLVLDPINTRRDKTRKAIYYVVGNGAPYEFPGTQTQASQFSRAWGATIKPSKGEWPTFLNLYTPKS